MSSISAVRGSVSSGVSPISSDVGPAERPMSDNAPTGGGSSGDTGGMALTQVRGGSPRVVVDGVVVRDGVVHTNPGPVTSQDYARTAQGGVTHPRGNATDSEVSLSGCGQATAAVQLARFGHFSSEEAADDHMRVPGQLGGSMYSVADYFRMRGLEATVRNGGTWDDLRRALDQGFGVTMTYTHSSAMHTMTVTAMFTGEDGQEYIQFMDVSGYGTRLMRRADFEHQWEECQLGGLGGLRTGIMNSYTLVGPAGCTFPPGGSVWGDLNAAGSLAVLDGANDLANSFRYFAEGEVVGGTARFLDGLTQLVVQAPATIVQAAGAGLELLMNKPVDWALGIWNSETSSGWEKFAAVLVLIFTYPLKLLGTGLRYLGQILSGITSVFARMLAFPFNALADWAHKDNDAASAVRYADPAGTPRERENWARLRDQTPVEPGKTYLINAMLDGHLNDDERAMILRVLRSCADASDTINAATLRQLIDAVGAERLSEAFVGSRFESEWRALQSTATGSAPAEPSAPAERSRMVERNAPRAEEPAPVPASRRVASAVRPSSALAPTGGGMRVRAG